MLRDVVLYTLQEELPKFELEVNAHYKLNKSEMSIDFPNGGSILLRSGDRPDALRGLNIHDFGIDEAREFKTKDMFDIMIGRIRMAEDAQWFITTTTKGKNWVWELGQRKDVSVIRQTTFDNPFLPDSYIKELTESYTNEFARQELYADIVEFGAGVIDASWFNRIDIPPPQKGCRFWDLAVSIKTSADNSAGALCGVKNDRFTIHDIKAGKWEYPDLRQRIISTAQRDGTGVIIGVEEAGQQRGFIDDLKRLPELRMHTIRAVKPKGDKLNRAMPWASRAQLGAVDIVRGKWNNDFFDECNAFTVDDTHQHDDMIDSVSGAYSILCNPIATTGIRMAI